MTNKDKNHNRTMNNIPWNSNYDKREQYIGDTLWLLEFHIRDINLKIKYALF